MSKNVAVFVDVANIFYAAKAAGIDIDYVTLLKAATAGRDFVRAYAYTGLDPENENQRQFHSFLARNGYKVISKDIRKYGDGRIKANLDIELVVDMMKTARNLDIAVIVSGDGDFASAVRAVQEMGVRVEVVSFRGNTSSDLIDVADQFTDIAQIARVDKSSARSGRRVAAEGDLSMTQVPEKETEGAPRRRRGAGRGREERQTVAEPVAAGLVSLPGERLSRAGDGDAVDDVDAGPLAVLEGADLAEIGNGEGAEIGSESAEAGQRRRRRRGGRGRGRGGRRTDAVPGMAAAEPGIAAAEDEIEFEELPPTQLPHHTFGSVWDTQLGVPTASLPSTVGSVGPLGDEDEEEEDLDEPEVPEYLLAERRQRGERQPRGRMQRGRSAYQAALDRERYGRGTASAPSGFGQARSPERAPDRSRDRQRGGRPPQGGRPDRQPRAVERPPMARGGGGSAEPWSEVPPELEEMLRAELARKGPAAESVAQRNGQADAPAEGAPDTPAVIAEKPAPARRRRTATPKAAVDTEAQAAEEAAPTDAPKPARPRRTAAAPPTADESTETVAGAPAKRATRSRTAKATAKEPAAEEEAAPKKPVRRRRTTADASSEPTEEG